MTDILGPRAQVGRGTRPGSLGTLSGMVLEGVKPKRHPAHGCVREAQAAGPGSLTGSGLINTHACFNFHWDLGVPPSWPQAPRLLP